MMLKVMIVDDEPLMRLAINSLIDWEENGFVVLPHAANGVQAIAQIEEETPDILFTDIQMPEMNGVEMIKYIHKHHPQIKIIVLSNYDDFSYVKEALLNGAVDYILKAKISAQSLTTVIDQLKEKLMEEQKDIPGIQPNQMRQSLELRKAEFIRELDSGTVKGEDIPMLNEKLDLNLTDTQYVACVILADGWKAVKDKYEDEKKNVLCNTLDMILHESCPFKTVLFPRNGGQYLALIYNDNKSTGHFFSVVHEALVKFQAFAGRYTGLSFTISISNLQYKLAALPEACTDALKITDFRFYRGTGKIYYSESIIFITEDLTLKWMNKETINRLKSFVERGNVIAAYEVLEEFFSMITSSYYHANSVRNFTIDFLIFSRNLVLEQVERIDEEVLSSEQLYEYINACDFYGEILDLARKQIELLELNLKQHQSGKYGSVVGQVVSYVHSHYDGDVNLGLLSDMLHVSSSYLSRIFLQKTGMNFVDFLTEVRIDKAKQLLQDFDLSISEITDRVGFTNAKYFGKVFKRECGVTPSLYRESLKK